MKVNVNLFFQTKKGEILYLNNISLINCKKIINS